MPNPTGSNQFYSPEPAYGEVQKKEALTKSAPMSGAPISSVSAPETAQRRAVQGRRSAPTPQKAPSGGVPPYQEEIALTWLEIASQPGASDLVKRIAQRAQRGMQYGS